MTWNGTTISGPVFIYQDEIVRDDRPDVLATPLDGTLICRSENQSIVGWRFAHGGVLSTTTTEHFRQRRTSIDMTPSVSRLSTDRPDERVTSAGANGLWTCQLSGGNIEPIPVGIFAREGGEGFRTAIFYA